MATTDCFKMAGVGARQIETVEMHTGGEPLRIIVKGYPTPEGSTILDKRRYLRENADQYRKMLMHEPRGHKEMYGALLVTPDHPEAHIGVIFLHNEGNIVFGTRYCKLCTIKNSAATEWCTVSELC